MSEKFKKLKKTFVLSDSSVNEYGFRLLTTGYLKDKYQRNPIGYYMHQRDGGVLLKWDNVRIEGDKVVGEPVINMSHPRGQQTVDEIESGFLNAASVGHIVVVEASDDPSLKLEGQTGVTVTKWYNKECSIVDIPGNSNALTELFDDQDNPINLADFTKQIKIDMNEVKLPITADLVKHLSLSGTPSPESVANGISNLAAANEKLVKDLSDMTEKFNQATQLAKDTKKSLDDLKAEQVSKELSDLLDKAEEEGKITADLKTELSAQYTEPAKLKAVLDKMKAYEPIVPNLKSGKVSKDGKKLEDLSWDELDKGGYLPDLKANNYTLYEQKFEAQFGKKPNK